jgi:anaerobic selenocysteine-containing dehydrogenase
MGGQMGSMRNEAGQWPEVCKKSLQAMAADMQDGLRPEFFRRYGIDHLRTFSPRELEASGRIVQPLYAGPGGSHYRVIDWGEAISRIVARLKTTPAERCFFYFSGRSSNESGFLLQLFARLFGTNNVNNCSYYCHQASSVAITDSIGSGTATVTLDDVEHADLFFLIGGNPASNREPLHSAAHRRRHRLAHRPGQGGA